MVEIRQSNCWPLTVQPSEVRSPNFCWYWPSLVVGQPGMVSVLHPETTEEHPDTF